MGEDLYNKLSIRDYSGSPSDEYAQLLGTLHTHALLQNRLEEFYSLLSKADRMNKKLAIDPEFENEMQDLFYEDIPFEAIVLV